GGVGAIAFGQYQSPDYETPLKFIPPVATRTGVPAVQSTNTLQFTLILPATPAPPGGYPVVIFGHGFTDSKQGAPIAVAGTLVALMQLVRLIQTGGIAGLSQSRIYYAGQSFGGIYGTILLGVEPDIRAGVPNVPGGPIIEIARLSPVFRPLVTLSLAARIPALNNGGPGGLPGIPGFTENIPLRNEPVRTDTVAGASAIQEVIDNTEWVSQTGNPVAYAPY